MNDFEEVKQADVRESWEKYAAAKAEHAYLDFYRKAILAILQKEAMGKKGCESVAAQDREARSDIRYLDVIEKIREAVELEELMRGEVKMAEWRFEAWKARIYADQREAKRYGH